MVKVTHIKDYLCATPFFTGLDAQYLELLSDCGTLANFKAGSFLLNEGEAANSFYLLREGEVAIESQIHNGILTIAKVGAGGVAGYSWLFPPYRNAFDVRAVTDVKAIKLDGACLRNKAEQDHELGYQLMKRFAEIMLKHMQSARRQMLDVYGNI